MLASRLGLVKPQSTPFTATSRDGTKISGLLEMKQKDSKQCVIIIHGGLDNRKAPVIRALADGVPYNVRETDAKNTKEG